MKKILHVTNRLSEGGVETFLLNLLPALRTKGYEVELLVLDNSELEMKEQFEAVNIKVFTSPYNSIYDLRNIFYLCTIFRSYDLIHSHLFPSQYFSALSALITRKRIVTTEHCNENKRRKFYFWPLEFIIYTLHNAVVGVSEAASKKLIKWIPTLAKKTITILNGIDLAKFKTSESLSKSDLNLCSDDFCIVMTARFFEQKDHDTLITALSYLPVDAKVLLIGSGERIQHCKELAKKLCVSDRCIFLGKRNDVSAIIAIADICVLSTHYEGLPVSIIEYMALGKAVVATNVDGIDEMIDSQFLFEESNARDLADKIMFLKNNNNARYLQEMINKKNSERYSLDEMINKYVSLYKKMD